MSVQLRDYQRAALEKSRQLYDAGVSRQLLVKATGLGKTITFASLIQVYPELARMGVLVLVHRDELVFQAVEKIRFVNPTLSIGIEKAEYKADLASDVIVASVQTLGHPSLGRLRPILREIPFGLIIVDEAHHMTPGSQYDRILTEIGIGSKAGAASTLKDGSRRLLFGVTATPNRHDKTGLSHFFDEIVLDYGITKGIEQGYLTDILHHRIKTKVNIGKVGKLAGDFNVGELDKATNIGPRNRVIVSAHKKMAAGKSFLVFCSSVPHAHTLADMFNEAGISCVAIDGTTPKEQRREWLDAHEKGEIEGITNFGVLTEGYDGRVHVVHMARPTKSTPLYIQMVGRGLRTIPANLGNLPTQQERLNAIAASVKPGCLVFDYVDDGHDVVTTPTLFGLNQNFDSQGVPLVGVTTKKVNSAIEKNPFNAEAIGEAESWEEVEIEAERINVWTMAKAGDKLKDLSKLRWLKIGQDTVQIEIPKDEKTGRDRFVIRFDQDAIGSWGMTMIEPKKWNGSFAEPEKHVPGPSYPSLERALKMTDQHIVASYPGIENLLARDARWRKADVSPGQQKMLDSFPDIEIPKGMRVTKGDASDLISTAKMIGMKQKRGAFRKPAGQNA